MGLREEIERENMATQGKDDAEDVMAMAENGTTPSENAFGTAFRNYDADETPLQKQVNEFYKTHHENQTYDFVQKMHQKWLSLDRKEMGIWEAAELLNEIVDESDPDLDLPQIEHLLQTAEGCRKAYPGEEYDWFHLAGFIHDLGKVMTHPSFGEEAQWATVGDTHPVGCAFDKAIIFHKHFANNPDLHDSRYNTKYGVYEPNCGLDKVDFTWGHDEYMYQVMKRNGCTLPLAAQYIVRFHSFYALHTGNAYDHLCNDVDREMVHWIREFNKNDLYTKSYEKCDVQKLKPYYMGLIKKYFPDTLKW